MDKRSQSRAGLLLAGSAFLAHGLLKRSSSGWLAAALGGSLTFAALSPGRTRSVSSAKPTVIRKTVTVMKAPIEAYALWRKIEEIPHFLSRQETVEHLGANRHAWSVPGKLGLPVTWETEIVNDQPGRLIEWRSTKDSPIQCAGSVRFTKKKSDRGTKIHLQMSYVPTTGFSAKVFNDNLLAT